MRIGGGIALLTLVLCSCSPAVRVEKGDVLRLNLETPETSTAQAEDGDSLIDADEVRYRLRGINAPDAGECLAETASDRLGELVDGEEVLVFHDVERQDQYGRELVYAYLRRDDEMLLINEHLVSRGLALAIHTDPPGQHQARLVQAQDGAISAGVGLWDPKACGNGPSVSVNIVEVAANPAGPDEENLEGEYVTIANDQEDAIDLTGWSIRDESTQNRFRFPAGTRLEAGETVTVTSGGGPLGFALGSPVWNNSGDTVYVLDGQGRIVASAPTRE